MTHIIGVGREVQARRKDGSVFPAFLSVGRIGSDPPRFVGFIQDMTLRQQALAALEREDQPQHRPRLPVALEVHTQKCIRVSRGPSEQARGLGT